MWLCSVCLSVGSLSFVVIAHVAPVLFSHNLYFVQLLALSQALFFMRTDMRIMKNKIKTYSLNFCREGGVASSFALSAGFPPKDVVDGAASVAEAGLLGAAITQKTV